MTDPRAKQDWIGKIATVLGIIAFFIGPFTVRIIIVTSAAIMLAVVAVCRWSPIATAIRKAPISHIAIRYVAIISTITLIMTILLYSSLKDLPDAKKVAQITRAEGKKIAARNMASISGGIDNIIHTILDYQKDPDGTRDRVYEEALKQTADKGYIFFIPQRDYYVTAPDKRNEERLLTEDERDRIENSLNDIFERSTKRDQLSLLHMVLSDIRVGDELWKPKERKVKLSPLDLMGVVGGYIGELILK